MNSEPGKTAEIQRRVIWNTITNYAGKIAGLGIWFFLTPFVLRSLGPSEYGLWVLVGSLISYGSLFDFGIASAVTKYVAEYDTRQEYDRARRLVATALWLYTISGLIVIGVSAILAPSISKIFNIPADQRLAAAWAVLLSGIGLGISLPAATPIAVLRGLQRFDLVNLISIIGTLLYALLIIVVLLLGGGLVGIVAINIPLTLLMQVPTIWLIYKTAPQLRFGWHAGDRSFVRTVASFSSALFVINISSQLQDKTDEVVIGAYLPVSSVTPYSIAHKLSNIPQILTDQFMKVLMPLASQLHSENDHGRLRQLYITSTRITLAIFLVLGSSVIVMARPFITLWVGAQYASVVNLVFYLTAASLLSTIVWPAGSVLQGMARHRLLAYTSLASGIVNLILSLILVRSMGVVGVALGTLIPTALESIFLVLPYTWRVLEIKISTAWKEILLPALAPAVPMLFVLIGLREFLNPASFWAIGLICGIGSLMYGIGYIWIPANAQERQIIVDLTRETFKMWRAKFKGDKVKIRSKY